MALLEIQNLRVEFGSEQAPLTAVDDLDLSMDQGEIVGIVGESGSGKSVTALALMGLIDYPGRVKDGRMSFAGRDLLSIS
jgi:dipeptide transport system ATP-binding protein